MKRILFILLIVGLMIPTRLMSQKVYEENNKVIFDLTEYAGMPPGAITAIKKYTGNYTSNNNLFLVDKAFADSENGKVFQKLEIAPHDMNGGILGTGSTMQWNAAFNNCKGLLYDSGGWRLPTQRELMLMYIFKPALEDILAEVSGSAFSINYYWSATEENSDFAFSVNFNAGTMSNINRSVKTSNNIVRCVREVED